MRLTPAIRRAADILDFVATSHDDASIVAIARTLGIPRNSAYEIVHTLSTLGFLQMSGDGRIRLGLRLFELGSAYAASLDLLAEAQPIVSAIVAACNETTHLAVLDDRHVVYLIKRESTLPVRVLSVVGGRIPAHATAVGKAVLAHMPRDEAVRLLRSRPLERLTPNTITDVDLLIAQLDDTVKRGYSTDEEESSPEVCCVAAPVRDRSSRVVAGLSISAPRSRMPDARRGELAALVMESAAELSARLGHAGDVPQLTSALPSMSLAAGGSG